jgi:hypothetical protein
MDAESPTSIVLTFEGIVGYCKSEPDHNAMAHNISKVIPNLEAGELVLLFEELIKMYNRTADSVLSEAGLHISIFYNDLLTEDCVASLKPEQLTALQPYLHQRPVPGLFRSLIASRCASAGLASLLSYQRYLLLTRSGRSAAKEALDEVETMGLDGLSYDSLVELIQVLPEPKVLEFMATHFHRLTRFTVSRLVTDGLATWTLSVSDFKRLSDELKAMVCRLLFRGNRPLRKLEKFLTKEAKMARAWAKVLSSDNPDAVWTAAELTPQGRDKERPQAPSDRDASPKRQ